MTKIGKVKFADHSKRYGYIVSSDAKGPTETLLFQDHDSSTEFDSLVAGSDVEFDVEDNATVGHAKNVKLVKLAQPS